MTKAKVKKLSEEWIDASGSESVPDYIELTGGADAYLFDGTFVSPCGKMAEDLILCSCVLCKPREELLHD